MLATKELESSQVKVINWKISQTFVLIQWGKLDIALTTVSRMIEEFNEFDGCDIGDETSLAHKELIITWLLLIMLWVII